MPLLYLTRRKGTIIPTTDPFWANVLGLYHFNDGNGSTVSYDSKTGNVVNFAATAYTNISSKLYGVSGAWFSAGTANLTGTSGYGFMNDWTIEFSVKFDSVSGNQTILRKRTDNTMITPILIYTSGTTLYCRVTNSSAVSYAIPISTTLSTGVWYRVAFVKSGAAIYGFLNGVLVSSSSVGGTIGTNGNSIVLGSDNNGSSNVNFLKGRLDEIRFTSVARYLSNYSVIDAEFPNK